jgi:hypothetical protein
MMKRYSNRIAVTTASILVFALVTAVWPGAGLGQDTAEGQDPWAKYQIILERNIFSRQRGPIREPGAPEEPREIAVPNPESYFILKGIVQEDSEFIAFVEDTRTSQVLRLRRGDSVARGTIAALGLDEIQYEREGQETTVTMGYDLEGGRGAVTAGELMEWSQTSAAGTGQGAATEEPAPPTGDEAEILKQLMERRRQQLGN